MKSKRNFICTAVLFVMFLTLTALVMFVDVDNIGPLNSEVGLSTINGNVFERLGENETWYEITEYIGYAALLVAAAFALITLVQFIRRRSLAKVDKGLIVLMLTYCLMAAAYIFFEFVIINYRPVLEEGALAASYPSSHTMLVCFIMMSGILQLDRLVNNMAIGIIAEVIAAAAVILTVVGRLLSGVHWFTDILAGLLLAATLVMLYHSITTHIDNTAEN